MKNFKFNYKLALALSCLAIGVVLIILGNKARYCLGVGLMLFGMGSFLYCWYKKSASEDLQIEIEKELENYDPKKPEDSAIIKELERLKITDRRASRRINFSFVVFGFLMFLMGIFVCL